MAIPFTLQRGSAIALHNYAGHYGEIAVDTTNDTLVVFTGAAGNEVRLAKYTELPTVATASKAGLMSAADKQALDNLVSGGGGGGSSVEYTPTLMMGTEIGVLTIDGEEEKIYAPIYAEATTTISGLMSTADKAKLDGINTANYITLSGEQTLSSKKLGGTLNLTSTASMTASSAPLVIGSTSSSHLCFSNTSITSYNSTSYSNLNLNAAGGNVFIGHYSGSAEVVAAASTTFAVKIGSNANALTVGKESSTIYTRAVTPAATSNSTDIATTAWVRSISPTFSQVEVLESEINDAWRRGFRVYPSAQYDGNTIIVEYTDANGLTAVMEVLGQGYNVDASKFMTTTSDVSTLTNFSTQNSRSSWYISGTAALSATVYVPLTLTAAYIYNDWGASLKADKTAKANTDIWVAQSGVATTNIPKAVRAITACGGAWDVPNIYQLIVLWVLADAIDACDASVAQTSDLRIGRRSSKGRFRGADVFSSTEFNVNTVRNVSSGGYAGATTAKTGTYITLPIRELSI